MVVSGHSIAASGPSMVVSGHSMVVSGHSMVASGYSMVSVVTVWRPVVIEWGVTELPALVFYLRGVEKPVISVTTWLGPPELSSGRSVTTWLGPPELSSGRSVTTLLGPPELSSGRSVTTLLCPPELSSGRSVTTWLGPPELSSGRSVTAWLGPPELSSGRSVTTLRGSHEPSDHNNEAHMGTGVGCKMLKGMNIDVTVDDIIDGIADVLYGDFSGVTREYVLQVNDRNYEELIITPKQNVLLLVYSKPKAEKESIQNFEQVAFAFRKDESILFAKLDAKKYQLLRDEKFKTRETPAVMWLANNEKTAPKRFGGMLSKPLLMQFVNERTNLKRNMEGTLQTDSGRVEAADKIIKENIEDLVEGNIQELKDLLTELRTLSHKLDDFEKELVDYYIYIVDSIALSGKMDTMYDILTFVEEAIAKGDEHDFVKTGPKLILSEHDFVKTGPKLILSEHDFVKTGHKLILSEHDFVKTGHKLILSEHDFVKTGHKLILSEHDFVKTGHKLILSEHDFVKTGPKLILSEHDFVKTGPKLILSEHDFVKTGPKLILSEHDFVKNWA
ncbi:hypothetical protein Btru_053373 [Bulinus truncatus]|nr:hypothetical protein Btru_053373 [Bulinus truncatus]